MTQDLQQLLEKIQRDGVEKAKAEAETVLAEARAAAKKLVFEAQSEAEKIKSTAQQESEAFERRAEATIRQTLRDVLLNVEKAVTQLLTQLLLKDVNAALSSPTVAAELAADAVRAYLNGNEHIDVACTAKLADALRAALAAHAASDGVTVTTDEATGSGFRIRLANGRIEHTFTGAAVTEALARQLRPRLASLLKTL